MVPSGTVRFCVGSCPFGECDETMALVDVPCSSFYPEPASATTVYCIPGDSGAYCLETDDGGLRTWGITCQDGAPSFKECTAPCVANSAGHLDSC